jgi:hypothetical protein
MGRQVTDAFDVMNTVVLQPDPTRYQLITKNGPCPVIFADTWGDAMRDAEKVIVLKRGWSIKWCPQHADMNGVIDGYRAEVLNSKGARQLSSTCVLMYRGGAFGYNGPMATPIIEVVESVRDKVRAAHGL